jgi:hypothetical protein
MAPPVISDPRSIATKPVLLINSITSCLAAAVVGALFDNTVALLTAPGHPPTSYDAGGGDGLQCRRCPGEGYDDSHT